MSGGNLGIGTTNPLYRLEVAGNAFVSSNLSVGTANLHVDTTTGRVGVGTTLPAYTLDVAGNAFVSSNLTVGTANLHVDTTTGRVGVGTTNPITKLDVRGALYLEGENLATTIDGVSDAGNLSNTYIRFGSAGTGSDWAYLRQIGGDNGIHLALDFHDDGNDSRFSIRDVQSTATPDTVATRFTVLGDGNVGIGTVSPISKLDVQGGGGLIIRRSQSGGINRQIFTEFNSSASVQYWKLASGSYVDRADNSTIISVTFQRVDQTHQTMRVNIAANYGTLDFRSHIDEMDYYVSDLRVYNNTTTSTFDVYLKVDSFSRVSIDMQYGSQLTVNQTPDWTATEPTASGTYILSFTNGSSKVLKLSSSGNVGIGTGTPAYKLDVAGTANVGVLTATTSTFSGDVTVGGNLIVSGTTTTINTTNLTIKDTILELGKDNTVAATDLGVIMRRPGSNVGIIYDGSVPALQIGHTLNGGSQSTITMDTANALAVSINGPVTVSNATPSTTKTTGALTVSGGVGVEGNVYATRLHTDDFLVHDGDLDTKIGFPAADTFTVTTSNAERVRVDSTGNVGIGTATPAYKLDVAGTANVGALTALTATVPNDGDFVMGGKPIKPASGLTWDSVNSKFGVGTASPNDRLDVNGNMRVGYSTAYTINLGNSGVGSYRSGYIYGDGTNMSILNQQNGKLSLGSNNNGSMFTIDASGNVGIGTASPTRGKLEVVGTSSVSTTVTYYALRSDGLTTQLTQSNPYSVYADGRIAANEFNAYSDVRIKKNIRDIVDSSALDTFRLLEPKIYNYIDEVQRGTSNVYGFIAQDVSNIMPYAVTIAPSEIPSILELANVSQSNVLTFVNFNTSNLESNTVIKIMDVDGNKHDITLVELIDDHTIRVAEDVSKWSKSVDNDITETITVDEYEALADKTGYVAVEDTDTYTKTTSVRISEQIFVYGQNVNDFHHLNKDSIWTVATAALQEVDRQQQADKVRIAQLESQLAAVLARLDALEKGPPSDP